MKAFTLIELIFVIIIIGIISGVGFSMQKSDYAYRDGEYLLLKLKEARYKAMGFEGKLDEGCIELNANSIQTNELNEVEAYKFRSSIDSNMTDICFDYLGRPHFEDNVDLDTLLQNKKDIILSYNEKSCTVMVYPLSGYGIIACH